MRSLPVWSHFMARIRPHAISLIVLALVLVVAGCAAAAATTTPTTSPQTAKACAAAPGFFGAKLPTAGARFPDLSFPAGAVGYSSSDPETNGFQFQIVHVCVAGSALDAVKSYLGSDLQGHGWVSQDTAPVSGDLSTPCAVKPLCFAKNDGARRYVVVEEIVPGAGLTLYGLRLIIQPLASGSATLSPGEKLNLDPAGPTGPILPTATPTPSPSASPRAQIPALALSQVRVPPPTLLVVSRT